jgi:hypothetical protein
MRIMNKLKEKQKLMGDEPTSEGEKNYGKSRKETNNQQSRNRGNIS